MEQLIEDYERRLKTLRSMLLTCNDPTTAERLKVKAGCYRSFLTDLKRAMPVEDKAVALQIGQRFKFPGDDSIYAFVSICFIDGIPVIDYDDNGIRKDRQGYMLSDLEKVI